MTIAELTSFFVRPWTVQRTIIDRGRGERFAFTGRARGSLVERGCLVGANGAWRVRRAYRVDIVGDRVRVRFEDGRDFFDFEVAALPRVEFEHVCAPDLYRGALTLDPTGWTLTWRVTGPDKDLTIESRYG